MIWSSIIGWLATALTLSSFMVKDIMKLRLVNSIGAITWVIYGIMIVNYPVIFTNLFILVIHMIYLFKWRNRNQKARMLNDF